MNIRVLDPTFVDKAQLDTMTSSIWTDRYDSAGDFEIYTLLDASIFSALQKDDYLISDQTDHVMIVESLQISTDVERGVNFIVKGRSLESILDRRIVWQQTILDGNLQDEVERLLNENAIAPTLTERAISNLIFEPSTDPAITSLGITAQFTGDNLYDAISSICSVFSIGFKITLNDQNQFVFKLYSGQDRSYNQETNPYVVFSPKFDNILGSNYYDSKSSLKTVALVAGEGEGFARDMVLAVSAYGEGTELDRRELFVDARDISRTIDGGVLTDPEYFAQLEQRGLENLATRDLTVSFDGEVESNIMYRYGRDFFLGDVVQIKNEFGLQARSMVTEIIFSDSPAGINIFPTFKSLG